jgi:diaminopimelate epimerase
MRFEKWQALGNDYVILEAGALPWELSPDRVGTICDPHFGLGADGVLLMSHGEAEGVAAELRIFNPDGSEAELSGNGARQAALYAYRHGWATETTFTMLTPAGEIRPTVLDDRACQIEMGNASLSSPDFPSGGEDGNGTLEAGGRQWSFQHVSIGNPQCAIEVAEGLEELDLGAIGPQVERHELFPNRTNVSFWKADGSNVRARIYERGVGETLSSGTGACGVAVAAVLRGTRGPITANLDGGDLLVEVTDELEVTLTGEAEPVFSGELSAELLDALK